MSKLSRDEVLKLAKLSRLKLTDEETERFRGELSEILEYVAMLEKADTKDLEPTYQVSGLKSVMRKDEIKPYQATPVEILKLAPKLEKNQYKVKRVL